MKNSYKFSVIIPIYNVEGYLEEAILSVINQSINFKDNIEIILVNDGSTDKSPEICKKYQENYQENIKYVSQKNAGVSVARNKGISLATGKYINFLDGDDKWDAETFEKVWDFFEKHNNNIDVLTCRQEFFEAKTGYTSLDYKFSKGTRLIDITSEPEGITLSASSTFFKKDCLKDYLFDETLKYGEDAKFITEIILEKEKYGLLKEGTYYVRKRDNYTSATQNSKKDITRYTNTIENYYKYLYELSIKKYKKIIPYIQYVVINGIKFRVGTEVPTEIPKKVKKTYKESIINILKQTNDDVIINTKNINYNIKIYMLKLKYQQEFERHINYDNLYITFKDKTIAKINNKRILNLDSIKIKGNKIVLTGIINMPISADFSNIYLKNNNNCQIKTKNLDEKNKLSFINENITTAKMIEFIFDNKKETKTLKFEAMINNSKLNIIPNYEEDLEILNNTYLHLNNKMIIKNKSNALIIKKYSILKVVKYKLRGVWHE